MNRQQYLQELESALRAKKVMDIEDILGEYGQHFSLKMADGFSETEIAIKLEKPSAIAEQFAESERPGASKKSGGKLILALGLGFADIFVGLGFVLLFGWVIVVGALAVSAFALGGCLVAGANIAGLIPPMPYVSALILGVSSLALGLLSSVGTIDLWLYMVQWIRAYVRWTKNTMGGMYPPLSIVPQIGSRPKRFLRNTAMISLAVFGVLFVAAFLSLMVYTGFKPFWHELSWFVG
jgi:uncharacterized membrane protein